MHLLTILSSTYIVVATRYCSPFNDLNTALRRSINCKSTAKTELLWISSKHCQSLLSSGVPLLQLGSDTVAVKERVHVLGVTMSSDLSLDKHVSTVCSGGFFRLRQLRRVGRSVIRESAAILVYACVTSRIDYCNAFFASAPKSLL